MKKKNNIVEINMWIKKKKQKPKQRKNKKNKPKTREETYAF